MSYFLKTRSGHQQNSSKANDSAKQFRQKLHLYLKKSYKKFCLHDENVSQKSSLVKKD